MINRSLMWRPRGECTCRRSAPLTSLSWQPHSRRKSRKMAGLWYVTSEFTKSQMYKWLFSAAENRDLISPLGNEKWFHPLYFIWLYTCKRVCKYRLYSKTWGIKKPAGESGVNIASEYKTHIAIKWPRSNKGKAERPRPPPRRNSQERRLTREVTAHLSRGGRRALCLGGSYYG